MVQEIKNEGFRRPNFYGARKSENLIVHFNLKEIIFIRVFNFFQFALAEKNLTPKLLIIICHSYKNCKFCNIVHTKLMSLFFNFISHLITHY